MTDIIDLMSQWWEYYQPDSRAIYSNILSGMRRFVPGEIDSFSGGKTEKIVTYQKQTASCQYWVKGLSAVCTNWNPEKLRCLIDIPSEGQPSGYGIDGGCDRLGRRGWCTKYDRGDGEDDLDQYVCIAPCIEKSGLGKQVVTETNTLLYRPLNPDEIKGYNPDENGVGQCDGWGMGRGDKGPFERLEDIYNVMPVCRHYRPHQMGFGSVQPRPYHGSDKPGVPFNPKVNWIPTEEKTLYDHSKSDPLTKMEVRLPFIFQMYNCMSMYQKCAHWEAVAPSFFKVDYIGSDPSMFCIQMSDESYCKCKDSGCNDYKNIKDEWTEGLPWFLTSVWAPYGGIVCNGAKPECPCYSGKWIYCIENRMRDGMSITADQIFELRFWASDWSSQEEYNAYYLLKPGPTRDGNADESTHKIYTFTKWQDDENKSNDPNKRIMQGKEHSMCMPAPLNRREFDVEFYITKADYSYPPLNENTGTNSEEKKATFPTLARELESASKFSPDINIIYPYFTIDPWEIPPCDNKKRSDYCYHDSNLMEDPLISFVGTAVFKKTVYVVNKTLSSAGGNNAFAYMDKYERAKMIPVTKLREFSEYMDSLIKSLEREGTAIFFSAADNYGFFEVSRVKLKLNELNEFYVFCKWKDGDLPEYSYRKRKVKSRYWAGLIEQKNTIHSHEGDTYYNYFPNFFYPSFYNIEGVVHTTMGRVQTVFSTYALYVYGIMYDVAYYAYCINEYSQKDEIVIKWCQVGATGYIWGEIDNIEISYLWPFTITKATISLISAKESLDPIFMCGSNASNITLEVIYPEAISSPGISNDRNAEIIRRALPPNAFLLKAPEPLPFFNKDWTLSIDYTYQRIDTFMGESDDVKVVWPYNMGTEWSLNQFAQSPYQIIHEEDSTSFMITEVGGLKTRGSMKVMAYIAEAPKEGSSRGRVQAAISTKFLLQGYNGGCRSVDIFYKYSADAASYDLEPAYGFFTWRGSPRVKPSSAPTFNTGVGESEVGIGGGLDAAVHSRAAKCGDHECNPGNCIGPMWFPFRNCTTVEFYNIQNGAAECTMPLSEAGPNLAVMGYAGWRYVIADKFQAWVTSGGNWASSCGTPWYYHYSMAGDTQRFTGYGNKKAKVDKWYYAFMGWALPPFGNTGRAFVERYITRDFASFIDLSTGSPHTSYEYMPMVFDKEDLFCDLNPFANPDEATPLHEPFSHFSMLSNYTAGFVSEAVSEGRYRFEDVIEPVYHGNCMYPHPVMGSSSMTRVVRYGFKNDNHVWAWPEFWKPLERNKSSDHGQMTFLNLSRPEYYFDYNKAEHRLITDEGEQVIMFAPPKKSSKKDSTDDSDASIYPSISIDGKHPRYFKILYDDYTSENVEWKDEATTGEEGASGGGEGGNIYEVANNGSGLNGLYTHTVGIQWLHDYNTIFDGNAEAEPNEDRKAYLGKSAFTGEDIYLYYNRGLIAFIARNRLIYLPVELFSPGPPILTDSYPDDLFLESYSLYWEIESSGEITGVPLIINISGDWGIGPVLDKDGVESKVIYSMPGMKIIEGPGVLPKDTGFPEWPEDKTPVDVRAALTGRDVSLKGLTSYNIKFELPRTPERLVSSIGYFMICLSSYPTEFIRIGNVSVEMGKYTKAKETISVWEKRYHVGEASPPELNADGSNTDLYRTYARDLKNAGQYFPFEDTFAKQHIAHEDGTFLDEETTDFEEGGKVISKLNMVGFTKIYREDEKLDISMDNLKDMELEAQHELHTEFFEQDDHDTLQYTGVSHPGIEGWLKQINAPVMRASGLALKYEKVDWEHNEYYKLLNQKGEFITPGGHYFIWSDNFFRTRCYYFGGILDVYKVGWVHERHAHGGGLNAEGDIETTWETGMAYAGWGRLHYMNGLFSVLGFLGQRDSISGQVTGVVTGMNVDKYS